MALIVIHRHTAVIFAAFCFGENRVGRHRSVDIESTRFQLFDSRDDFLGLFEAKHSVFAAVGVETCDADVWILDSELLAGIRNKFGHFDDTCFFHEVASLAQRDMGRYVDHTDILVSKHHGILFGIGESCIEFRVAVVVVTGKVKGLFVERSGDCSVNFVSHCKLDGFLMLTNAALPHCGCTSPNLNVLMSTQ